MVTLIVQVDEPPDKNNEVETFETDKIRYIKAELVGGTRRVKRFTIRAKVNT